jgi:fructose-1,6-bisphosphatase/inositol monophosphatase family enzyme
MDIPDSRDMLGIAVGAAARAADRILAALEESRGAVSSRGHDIKIAGDASAEAEALEFLAKASRFPALSEEAGVVGGSAAGEGSPYRWILDPIDGSLNFNRGIPLCCVSVALWKGDEPVLGVVHDFNRGEVFTGIVGQGAAVNGVPMAVSGVSRLQDAVLCTGFPVYSDFSEAPLLEFVRKVQSYKKVRLLGSAALSLAYVAAGRADAYMEDGIMAWDVGAGLALVLAAGGKVESEPLVRGLRIRASNGRFEAPR